MPNSARTRLAYLSLLSVAGFGVGGCSSPPEDVRVTLCKNLTISLLELPRDLTWKEGENRIRRPEYATTVVRFDNPYGDAGLTAMEAACSYRYDLPEESAMDHAFPLTAYATLPFEMTINGEPVPESVLTRAVGAEQMRLGKKLLDRANKGRL